MTMRRRIERLRVGAGDAVTTSRREDRIAVEEPLEIRVGGAQFAVTMRTPGDDFDLVAGFLLSEGVLGIGAPAAMRVCAGPAADGEPGAENDYNVIDATLGPDASTEALADTRRVLATSACGLCGIPSLDAVTKASRFDVADDPMRIDLPVLLSLPDRLREHQRLFDDTGGVHAAGLFTADGDLLCLREDVGRHNAVDKVVGWAIREGRLPLSGTVLQVSGRASFELVQKARLAGIPMLSAVSAPSTAAVAQADAAGLTLAGFSRGTGINLYTRGDRVAR